MFTYVEKAIEAITPVFTTYWPYVITGMCGAIFGALVMALVKS